MIFKILKISCRPITQQQSVRSTRSETAQFTFEEDAAAANQQRNSQNHRDVTFNT